MAAATQKIIIHADDKTGAAIASAVRNSKKLDRQLQTTNNVMRTTTRQGRAQMGQLGHQVQDIAVQLQMGMNPLMVFAQQGSQIAAVFGAGGAVVGALLASAAAIGSALLPALFKANEEFDKFVGRVKEVTLDLKDMSEPLRQAIVIGAQKEVAAATKRFSQLKDEIRELGEDVVFLQSGLDSGKYDTSGAAGIGFVQAQIDSFTKSIQEKTVELAIAQKAITTAQRNLANFKTEVGSATPPVYELAKGIVNTTTAVDASNQKLEKLADLIRDKLQTPMGSFMEQQAQMKLLVEEGYLSIDQMNARLKQLKEELDLLPKDPFKDVKKSGIDALEDGLVALIDGTKSVKEAFKDMARTVISSLLRMHIQQTITNPLAASMGIKRGAAIGGPIEGRKPYLVGEKGPELFIPNGSGRMKSNDELGGGGSVNVTMNISTGVSQTVRAELTNMLPQITQAAQSVVADARMRGGSFSNAMGS